MKQNRTISINKSVIVSSKTPQVLALASIIKQLPADSITEEALAAHLRTDAGSVLKTKQDPMLIFNYYRRQLLDAGLISMDVAKRAVTSVVELFSHDTADWECAGGDYSTME